MVTVPLSPAPGGGLTASVRRWPGSVKDRRRRHVCARRASLTGSGHRSQQGERRRAGGAPRSLRGFPPPPTLQRKDPT